MHVVPFLSYVFVTSFTPGPNNIMSMANANQYGFFKTLRFVLGVSAGFFLLMLMTCYFNLLLFSLIPKIQLVMSILGSIYMMYLAFKIMKRNPKTNLADHQTRNSFSSGLILQFVNPKVIVYGITVISTFVIPVYKSTLSFVLFSLLLGFVGFLANFSWAAFGAVFQKFLSRYQTGFNIVMGLLLIYSAVSIFV